MINNLKVKSQKFTSLSFCLTNVIFINPNTSKTAKDAVWKLIELKVKIVNHQNTFSSQLEDLVDV